MHTYRSMHEGSSCSRAYLRMASAVVKKHRGEGRKAVVVERNGEGRCRWGVGGWEEEAKEKWNLEEEYRLGRGEAVEKQAGEWNGEGMGVKDKPYHHHHLSTPPHMILLQVRNGLGEDPVCGPLATSEGRSRWVPEFSISTRFLMGTFRRRRRKEKDNILYPYKLLGRHLVVRVCSVYVVYICETVLILYILCHVHY